MSHDYWPAEYGTSTFWESALRKLLTDIFELNTALGCSSIVLPGLYAEQIDDDWLARQRLTIDEAKPLADGKPLLATIALSAEALGKDDELDELLASAQEWEVAGVYLVCEHPRGEYLTTDASWMANMLDLVAGLRLKGKTVTVGYCNHQMLALAAAGATAIASGTWMNVRSFPPEKFRTQYEEEIKQRATWYYCPQALSEYKIPFLDIARKQGVLAQLAPSADLGSKYADVLFAGAAANVNQVDGTSSVSPLSSVPRDTDVNGPSSHVRRDGRCAERALEAAETLLATLHSVGVKGRFRDFHECVDVNRAALAVLRSSRGPVLRRKWDTL